MNVEEVIDVFIKDNQARFSSEIIRSYKLSLKQFFEFCPKNYNEIKATDIRAWLAFMEEKGRKKPTIHIKLSGLKSFYQYCMEENLLKKNPTKKVKTPKKEDDLPYYISRYQLAQLQELTLHDNQFRPIIETLYATGVRVSELINIRLVDIKD